MNSQWSLIALTLKSDFEKRTVKLAFYHCIEIRHKERKHFCIARSASHNVIENQDAKKMQLLQWVASNDDTLLCNLNF